MPGRNQIHCPQTFPTELIDSQHPKNFLRRKRHKGFDGNRRIGRDLQSHIQNRLHPGRIGLDHLPRFGIGQVFIPDTRNIHGVFQSFAEMVILDIPLERSLYGDHFRNGLAVIICQAAACRNLAAIILLRQHQCTIHKITQYGNQLVVITRLEILPRKVVIFRFGSVGT